MTRTHVSTAASANTAYQQAWNKLQQAYDAQNNDELRAKINALALHVETLNKKKNVLSKDLIAALDATTTLLETPANNEAFSEILANYEKTAQTMQGSSSSELKVLGGFMIALAITALVAGILIAPMLTMILAATVAATAASASSMAIGGIAATVALPTLGGLGFFAQSTRGGLSKAMGDVAQQAKTTSTEVVPTGAYAMI